jgi:signal transduction histidine kinase
MNSKLKNITHYFIASIVGLVSLSIITLGSFLYLTNAINISRDISMNELMNISSSAPEVQAYIESQKNAQPHFVKLTNLIEANQQELLLRALIFTGIPILLVSAGLAYYLARRLVKPVEETFADQERFLQDASHELRNPLAALSVVIQDAVHSKTLKEKNTSLQAIQRQTDNLIKLNEDLLLLERSKQGAIPSKPINASELLLDTIDSIYPHASQKSIVIKPTVAKDIRIKVSDKDWVCLSRNILENAVKYSAKKGIVRVHLKKQKHEIVLTIEDKGIGIPKDEIEKISERFYRAKNVGRESGTGLGLAIVAQIAEKYGGSLRITSSVQKSTRVVVKLPVK